MVRKRLFLSPVWGTFVVEYLKIMKKILLILVFVALLVCPVFSGNRGIKVLFGNDCWTGALSYNNDDLLSYSFGLEYEAENFSIRVDALGFTGRLLNDRFDIIEAYGTYKLPLAVENLTVTARAGFDLYGYMHVDYFQNALHRSMKIPEVHLPYSKTDISFIPYIGVKASYGPFYADLRARFGLEYSEEIGVEYKYDLMGFKAGYEFMQNAISEVVLEKYLSEASGVKAGYSLDLGKFTLDFTFNVLTGNGYTRIAIAPLAACPEHKFSYSVLPYFKMSQFKQTCTSHEIDITDNIIVVSRYNTGGDENKGRIDNWIWGAGYSYNLGNFSFRAIGQYLHTWFREVEGTGYKNTRSNHVGLSVEASAFLKIYKDYKLKLVVGASYFTGYGFGYELGGGFSL